MTTHMHHAHLFASDVNRTINFYVECLGAKVIADMVLAGARNIFMQIGNGRIHLYEQAPRGDGQSAVHHLGIQTDNLTELVTNMKEKGVSFRKEISDFGFFKYVMVAAPDNVLLELFEVDRAQVSPELAAYFKM